MFSMFSIKFISAFILLISFKNADFSIVRPTADPEMLKLMHKDPFYAGFRYPSPYYDNYVKAFQPLPVEIKSELKNALLNDSFNQTQSQLRTEITGILANYSDALSVYQEISHLMMQKTIRDFKFKFANFTDSGDEFISSVLLNDQLTSKEKCERLKEKADQLQIGRGINNHMRHDLLIKTGDSKFDTMDACDLPKLYMQTLVDTANEHASEGDYSGQLLFFLVIVQNMMDY